MTKELLSELDGLSIAIEIEQRGHGFYQQAYTQAIKNEHKELFLLLRDEENHHMIKFQSVLNKLREKKSKCENEYSKETSRYISVLSADHIFPKTEDAYDFIVKLKTIDEILRAAMQAEKDSILLYDELALKSKSPEAVKIFAALKSEEQQHVVKLREMIDAWA